MARRTIRPCPCLWPCRSLPLRPLILAVRRERSGFVTLALEIHYGWAESFVYSGRYPARALGGVLAEAGQHAAIRPILPVYREEDTHAVHDGCRRTTAHPPVVRPDRHT